MTNCPNRVFFIAFQPTVGFTDSVMDATTKIKDHPLRYAMANELHARPFPVVDAPAKVAFLAISLTPETDSDHRAFLHDLLDRYGASIPPKGAGHHTCELGAAQLKWERHSEFATFTLYKDNLAPDEEDLELHEWFPVEWLSKAPGELITSVSLQVKTPTDSKGIEKSMIEGAYSHFVQESLAVSFVLGKSAVVASDFRIGPTGHVHMIVAPVGQCGRNRIGRIVQRMLEIETYKTMAMMSLPVARSVFKELSVLDKDLTDVVSTMADQQGSSTDSLDRLLTISARIESIASTNVYRFSAATAYSDIVSRRIEVLREDRLLQRQTIGEFMMRRFEPSMRTCEAARRYLEDVSARASRASELLSTRVSVKQNRQNRKLLAAMNERAAAQLRLQQTVEGLSVVAISYYAVNLLSYLLAPLAKQSFGIEKAMVSSIVALPVILLVWMLVRRLRKHVTKTQD